LYIYPLELRHESSDQILDILWLHFRFTSVDVRFVFDEVIIDTGVLLSEKVTYFTINTGTVFRMLLYVTTLLVLKGESGCIY
jgi:hypothetical protein